MKQQNQAKELHQQGKSLRQIAAALHVSKSSVQRWLSQQPVTKSWLNPRWVTLQGSDPSPVDQYGAIPAPDAADLLRLNEDTVFSCVDWCAKAVAKSELKLLVTTHNGQRQPKCLTAPVVCKSYRLQQISKTAQVREVLDHPLKELLDHPNPEMSRYDALYYLDSQLSLTGNAYIHVLRDEYDGLPVALWPLLTQYVEAVADKGRIVGYKYSLTYPPIFYKKEDVIHLRMIGHENPYSEGYGPVRAVYERILLGKNELAYLNSLFRNQARPDQLISVKGGITPDAAERLQEEFSMRFRQGGIGGPFVTDADEMDVKPLSWSPKDVLGVELYKWTKLQIINAFALNPALFDQESSNRAVATEARRQAQTNAIEPRLRLIEERLNHCLLREFDERLLLEFESPVEEDQDFDLQKRTQYLSAGVYTVDEVRRMEGLPVEEAETPLEDAGGSNDLRATVGGSQQIMALQTAVYGGQLPREAAIANAVTVFGFSRQEAEGLFPKVKPQAPPPPPGQPPPGAAPPGPELPGVKSYEAKCQSPLQPGPCPEGGHEQPANKPSASPQASKGHAHATKKVSDALAGANLAPEVRQSYEKAAHAVISKMTPTAALRFAKNVSNYHFHNNSEDLTKSLADKSPTVNRLLAKGKTIGGAYDKTTGELHLDGGHVQEDKPLTTVGVYAHEYGHAIDGVEGRRISDKPEWQAAWEAELKNGKISKYAGVSAVEGFAEFSRVVHATKLTPEQIAKVFPRCTEVWKKENLL